VLAAAAVSGASCAGRQEAAEAAQPRRVEPFLASVPDARFDGSLALASIFPSVGRYALSGIQSANGARLAVDDVNLKGGINDRRLRLLEYATGSYFVDARHAAEQAAGAGALAIVGSNSSSLSMAIAEVAEGRRLVQISNVSTAQDLTWNPASGTDRPFVFRVCASDAVMGAHLADFAREHLAARRAAVLYEVGRTYSAKLARAFIEGFRGPGRTVGEFFYLPLETDFRSQLQRIAGFEPDLLFVPGSFTDATLIAEQARALRLRPTFLGGDAWSNRLLFKRGGPARRAFYSDHCDPPAAFLARYRERFGEEADGCRAVLAYDAVQALAAALLALGPLRDEELLAGIEAARERLRRALAAVELGGQAGRIRFDEHGDSRRGVAMMEVDPAQGYRARLHRWIGER
jgi:branched-chain amino acid transport system substrate-binding protein